VVLYERSVRLVIEVVVSLVDGKVRSWQAGARGAAQGEQARLPGRGGGGG